MQVEVRFLSSVVVAVALLVSCGGPKSPRAKAPEMHTWIPADAPYVVAMLEPVGLEYIVGIVNEFGDRLVSEMRVDLGDEMTDRLLSELKGKNSVAGLESLGLATKTYFAVYGDGDAHVMRMDLKDGNAMLATATRLAQRFNEDVPKPEVRGEYRVWQVREDDGVFVLALGPTQLALAYGPPATIEKILPGLVGGAKPARSIADTGELFALRDAHHPGAQLIGIADTAKLGATYAPEGKLPECSNAIAVFAKRVPRAMFAFALLPDRHEVSIAVDVAPDLVAELRALRVALPPLAARSAKFPAAQRPLATFAGGIDVPKSRIVGTAAMQAVKRVAQACHAPKHVEGADEVIELFKTPLPNELAGVSGAIAVVNKFAFPNGALLPTEVDGFVLLSGTDLKAVFEMAKENVGSLLALNFALDGKLHPIPLTGLPISLPFEVAGGGSPKALAIAVGAGGKADAQRALSAAPEPSPFMYFEGDYERMMQIRKEREGNEDDEEVDEDGNPVETDDDHASKFRDDVSVELYSRAAGWIDVDDRGVKMHIRYDLKQPR